MNAAIEGAEALLLILVAGLLWRAVLSLGRVEDIGHRIECWLATGKFGPDPTWAETKVLTRNRDRGDQAGPVEGRR